MEWSVIDLASITGTLIDMLRNAVATSPLWTETIHGNPIQKFNIDVSGAMPAVVRDQTDCMLSLYLLHVARDPYWRNTPPAGALARTNQAQPLSLNLSYLLTAYDNKNFWHEQQAMSIALNCFHQNPIYQSATEEFTITVEADTIEEMSRLWQAITVPIRLSAMFRVAVIFLRPAMTAPTSSPPPISATVSVGNSLLPGAVPQLFQIATTVTYLNIATATDPSQIQGQFSQPTTVGGAQVRVGGTNLGSAAAVAAYIALPDTGPEWPITSWWDKTTPSSEEMVLNFPANYAVLPAAETALAGTPPPGEYVLTVGDTAAPGTRSTPVPIAIAPRVDGVTSPPQLSPNVTGVYTITGAGFTAGLTAVSLNGFALTSSGAAAPGAFAVTGGNTITFMAPTAPPLASGRYGVHIVVNGVPAPPSWWIAL